MTIDGVDVGPASINSGEEHQAKQVRHIMGDGTVRVRDKEMVSEFMTYTLQRMTPTMKNGLVSKVYTSRFAMIEVDVIDDTGLSFTGRFWDQRIAFKRRPGDFWSATVKFRTNRVE